jgi:BirA family biotin operon repressor/biotin-[acetyl-CoA-carboxylase] ligase
LIETVATTPSTNAELIARLSRGETVREGDWLVGDRQTQGRGRQGREWFDGLGNFMGSTVVHTAFGDPPMASLALVAGLALHEVVSARLNPPAQALLKWPNDMMIGSAKLAGILLERVGNSVVIGVGVNLAAAPPVEGRQVAALAQFGPPPERDLFASDLAATFSQDLERWRCYGLAPVLARWQAAAHPPGTRLAVGEPGETPLLGAFAGLADDGALRLRLADGTIRAIHAGEVRLAVTD